MQMANNNSLLLLSLRLCQIDLKFKRLKFDKMYTICFLFYKLNQKKNHEKILKTKPNKPNQNNNNKKTIYKNKFKINC